MTAKAKKTEVTWLSVLFCLMVILHHCLSEGVVWFSEDSWQAALAFVPWKLLHMAVYGFVFLSGVKLFLQDTDSFSLGRFYRRRVWVVVVPYLIAAAVYLLLEWLTGSPMTPLEAARYVLLGEAASHLYFVIIIVQFYLLMPLWRWIVRRLDGALAIPALFLVMLTFRQTLVVIEEICTPALTLSYYMDRFFVTYLGVWICGCYAGRQYDAFIALLRRNRWLIWAAALVFGGLDAWLNYRNTVCHQWIASLDALNSAWVLFGILGLYALADRVCAGKTALRTAVRRFDGASYLIYLYHMLVLLVTDMVMNWLGFFGIWRRLGVRFAVVLAVTVPLCIGWKALTARLKARQKG